MQETPELSGQMIEASGAGEARLKPISPPQESKKRFKSIDRNQLLIRPVDVEKLVPEEHPARISILKKTAPTVTIPLSRRLPF